MSSVLLLVRHGVTASNVEGRYMGRSQEPLASEGRWQARLLARRLADAPVGRIVSSPLRRARETAAIIGHPHGLDPEADPSLIELDLGRWEGLSAAEIAARDPEAWHTWCNDPEDLRIEGIEPLVELRQRARRWLDAVTREDTNTDDRNGDRRQIIAVTHDGIVRVIVLEALGIPSSQYRSIPVDNAALTVIEMTPRRNYLRALNDTGHLAGSGATESRQVASPAERR